MYGLPPQEDAIFVGTQWPHMLVEGTPGFCAARDRHWPNSFIGYQSQLGLSRDTPLLYILSFFSYNVHKSGISLSSPGLTTSDSADLQMRHQKLCTLARHFSVGHFA